MNLACLDGACLDGAGAALAAAGWGPALLADDADPFGVDDSQTVLVN